MKEPSIVQMVQKSMNYGNLYIFCVWMIKILIFCQYFYYFIGQKHLCCKPGSVLPRWCRLADMTRSSSAVILDSLRICIRISSLDTWHPVFLDIFLTPWLTSSLETQLLFFRSLLSQADPGLEQSRGMVVLLVFSIRGTPDTGQQLGGGTRKIDRR